MRATLRPAIGRRETKVECDGHDVLIGFPQQSAHGIHARGQSILRGRHCCRLCEQAVEMKFAHRQHRVVAADMSRGADNFYVSDQVTTQKVTFNI